MNFKRFQCDLMIIILIYYNYNQCVCITRPLTRHEMNNYKEKIVEMFYHSYESYLKYASNYDELQPISCKGTDTWGQFSLSLIDALDTLAVLGNYSEFRRVAQLVLQTADFNTNINVSVFETNIRVIGGLLSAHLLSHKAGLQTEPGWPCAGPLLRLAEDAARRLLPAFETSTGMPYGTVNLRYGVPENETPITCTAGVGTFIVEFCTLSRLTGDPIFERKALKALYALDRSKSKIGLVGNHINVEDGKWTATESGIGGGVDSYLEYLVKGAILLQMPQLMDIFYDNYRAINKYIKKEDWYVWVSMTSGTPTMPIFQSLEAFWPGVLTLIGDVDQAKKTLYNYHQVWKQYGFTPEFYDIPTSKLNSKRDGYPLRPEFIESVLYLYRATKDPHLLQIGADVIDSIASSARTECGYATVKSVNDHTIEDRMESFFLAETLKYLYLLFDETNFVHNDGSNGTVIDRNGTECVIDSGGYIFNTEAHLIDVAAVYCCSNDKNIESNILNDFRNDLDLYSILDINQKSSNTWNQIREKYRNENEIPIEWYFEETSNANESEIGLNSTVDSEVIVDSKNRSESMEYIDIPEDNEFTPRGVVPSKSQNSDSSETLTTSTNTEEGGEGDPLSPTLDSSLSPLNIPNVEKTDSQDLRTRSDFSAIVDSVVTSDENCESLVSIDVKETTQLMKSSTSVPQVIEPTHSVEGWHSKSDGQDLSESDRSVLSANTLISDILSEEIIKVLTNASKELNNEIFINSSHILDTDPFNGALFNYELLLCPSQPFLSRLSYFGQIIIYR